MSNHVKRFLQQNRLFRVVFFEFLIDQIDSTRSLSKEWRRKVEQILQQDLNFIKAKLQHRYASVFTIQQSPHFSYGQQLCLYKTPDKRKLNIDFVINLHLKQKYDFNVNSKYTISYSFELGPLGKKRILRTKKKAKKYFWKLQFEYIGDQNTPKTVWMYKDYKSEKCYESDNEALANEKQIDEDSVPYIMDCQPVRRSEILQLRLPYCVRNNLIDFSKLDFYALEEEAPQTLSTLERFFNQKLTSTSPLQPGSCYIEATYQWKPYDYYKNPISFELDDAINSYRHQLVMQQIHTNNLQDHYKIELLCQKPLKESVFMGHKIEILDRKSKYQTMGMFPVVELKRKGIYEEKMKKVTFRVGDRLVVYLCELGGQ